MGLGLGLPAEVSVVASTLDRLTLGNLRRKARAVPTWLGLG